jgi:SAM-dependent methyltransferase
MPVSESSNANALRLFLCGLAVLFWELALIRWLGATIRIVAYFSNLVLISAFFGLGVGALMTRFRISLERFIAPLAGLAVVLGLVFGGVWHANPATALEYIWIGTPAGVELDSSSARIVSAGVVLMLVYITIAALFAAFGQYMGRLFRTHAPLRAYSLEVTGSLVGILLFAVLSHVQAGPAVWFGIGAAMLLVLLPVRVIDVVVTLVVAAVAIQGARIESRNHTWSPYYRISLEPITSVQDHKTNARVAFPKPVGNVLTVNHDYHQMMLDLRPRESEHQFLASWRAFYDAPYITANRSLGTLPPGRILVVGAGTGNDVAAALRRTDRLVTAVEIDPAIATFGRRLHAESPYDDPRVTLVIDDARSFFHRAGTGEYAAVVFGFLDSHRLLSAFSSVRLDNFIYTDEAMREVHRILAPGGRVALSFASNRQWIHERLGTLVGRHFGRPLLFVDRAGYANGIIYFGVRTSDNSPAAAAPPPATLPTDDWPFLYLQRRSIPEHNIVFLIVAIALSAAAFLLLPRGERRIRVPYLLLGAAFFLVETSNVVRMALLFGSTWWVNTIVFAGILALVLLANLTASRYRVPVTLCISLLAVGMLIAAVLPASWLLELGPWPRAVAAVAVYLSPIYFGGLIFARLIESEARLYEAYGSNILGAVLGGTAEYFSLLFGFRFLLAIALVCYLGVFLLVRPSTASAR